MAEPPRTEPPDHRPSEESTLFPSHATATRLVPIVMLLFPGLWGALALLNNLSGFGGTVNDAIRPLLAMTDTYGNASQTWRAVTAPWAAPLALVAVTAMETAAGVLSLIGIGALVRNFRAPAAAWNRAKVPGILGCLAAILVWGIGFMVVAGDWFLSWQGKAGIQGQLGGLLYALPAMLALLVLMREDR
jgi:predicted small integral membrane protein